MVSLTTLVRRRLTLAMLTAVFLACISDVTAATDKDTDDKTSVAHQSQEECSETPVQALMSWVNQHGGWVSDSVQLKSPTGQDAGDLGFYATQGLEAGQTVTATPLSLVINVEHAFAVKDDAELQAFISIDSWNDLDIMAVFVAAEASKPNSFWAPFLAALPSSDNMTSPMMLSSDDLELLSEATVYPRIVDRNSIINETYDLAQKAGAAANAPVIASLNRDQIVWAYAVLHSRSHRIGVRDQNLQWQTAMCLVPLADMFNMDPKHANVECFTGDEGFGVHSTFYCRTTRDVAANEQLVVQYISRRDMRTNARLYLDYGFVPEDNPVTVVELQPPDLPTEAHAALADQLGISSLPIPSMKDAKQCRDSIVMSFFRIAALTEANAKTIDVDTLKEPLLPESELQARAKLLDFLSHAHKRLTETRKIWLDRNPRHCVDDSNSLPHDTPRDRRIRVALTFLKDEESILATALDVCAGSLASNANDA